MNWKKKLSKYLFILLVSTFSVYFSPVEAVQENKAIDPKTVFVRYGELEPQELIVPSVVEVEVGNSDKNQFAVYEIESNSFQPFTITTSSIPVRFKVYSDQKLPLESALNDNNRLTFVEYPLQSSISKVVLTQEYEKPITSSSLEFSLDKFVSMPDTIKLEVQVRDPAFGDYSSGTVLAEQEVTNTKISFPQTSAQRWYVTFTYSQPLRINEIAINPTKPDWQIFNLRFLAKPSQNYRIYMLPDQDVYIPTSEMGNLLDDNISVLPVKLSFTNENPLYQRADQDNDRIFDIRDNCPQVSNPDQEDVNRNGIGDACEDFDLDGVLNINDNCPDVANRYQQDEDGDGIGDHCDQEESRLTERLFWLPWAGIIVGFGVVIGLLYTTVSWFTYIKKPDTKPQTPGV